MVVKLNQFEVMVEIPWTILDKSNHLNIYAEAFTKELKEKEMEKFEKIPQIAYQTLKKLLPITYQRFYQYFTASNFVQS